MDSVARAMPALMRAEKLQGKAAKAGFDWPEIGPALDKVSEELSELRRAVEENTNVEEELGDLLFAAAKAGRFAGVDRSTPSSWPVTSSSAGSGGWRPWRTSPWTSWTCPRWRGCGAGPRRRLKGPAPRALRI